MEKKQEKITEALMKLIFRPPLAMHILAMPAYNTARPHGPSLKRRLCKNLEDVDL